MVTYCVTDSPEDSVNLSERLGLQRGNSDVSPKGPYPLGDMGVIGGRIGQRWPILLPILLPLLLPITLWVWVVYWATGRWAVTQ